MPFKVSGRFFSALHAEKCNSSWLFQKMYQKNLTSVKLVNLKVWPLLRVLLHSTIGVTSTSQPQNNLYFMKNCPSVAIKSLITNENMDSVSCRTFYINEYMPFKMIKSNKLSGNLEILMVEIILVKMKIFLLNSYEPSSRTFFSSIE